MRLLWLLAAAATARKRARNQRIEERDFYRNATTLNPVKTVAAVVLSHNHEATVTRIADALSGEVDSIVIVEDGSTDNSYEAWRSALQEYKNARIIQTPDVHEIRAYNRGAAIANADVYCFLQDDDVPNDRGWGTRVMSLMDSFRKQRLAVLSGLATEVCQSEWGEVQVEHPKQMKNPRVTRRIPYAYRGVPFACAAVHESTCRGAVAESSRPPPRHRRDACSMAWSWVSLTARFGQHGRVFAENGLSGHPTHWLITHRRFWPPRRP